MARIVNRLQETRQWRMRVEVVRQLPKLVRILPKGVVLDAIAPVFMTLLTDPVEIVRRETWDCAGALRRRSACAFVVLNAAMEANPKRGVVYLFQIILFAKSPKYNTRELFLLCCPQLKRLLSSHSFKKMIRPIIVMLAADRVACVRECVVDLILDEPGVKEACG